MQYNKCYQCQDKDQVLGTSFCSITCKELWIENTDNRPKIDNFAEKLKSFREKHLGSGIPLGVTPEEKSEFDEAVDYMDKLFTNIPARIESQDNGSNLA